MPLADIGVGNCHECRNLWQEYTQATEDYETLAELLSAFPGSPEMKEWVRAAAEMRDRAESRVLGHRQSTHGLKTGAVAESA